MVTFNDHIDGEVGIIGQINLIFTLRTDADITHKFEAMALVD